jgi:hypothetical protein
VTRFGVQSSFVHPCIEACRLFNVPTEPRVNGLLSESSHFQDYFYVDEYSEHLPSFLRFTARNHLFHTVDSLRVLNPRFDTLLTLSDYTVFRDSELPTPSEIIPLFLFD